MRGKSWKTGMRAAGFLLLGAFFLAPAVAQAPVTTEDWDAFEWHHIGPWTFSGRITDFAVPKDQSLVYYVATGTGGAWKTEDGGKSLPLKTHSPPVSHHGF